MKHQIASICIALAMSSPALADNSIQEQEVPNSVSASGIGIGAVLGALAAGPVGAFVGGIGGLSLAHADYLEDELHETKAEYVALLDKNGELEFRLMEMSEKVAEEESCTQGLKVASADRETAYQYLAHAKQRQARQLEAVSQGFMLAVHFKSESAEIAPHFQEQLSALARSLLTLAELKVDLTGYSDPRGDEKYNQQLSNKRVDAVRALLVKAGVSNDRISVRALGESASLVDDKDIRAYPFERLVQISFQIESDSAVASLDRQ